MSLSFLVRLRALSVLKHKEIYSNLNEECIDHRRDETDLHLSGDASDRGDDMDYPPNSQA